VLIVNGLLQCWGGYATAHNAWEYNILLATWYALTATTSALATIIIAYRIYSFTSQLVRSRRSYRSITEIMIQSVSVYTALMLGQALCVFLTASEVYASPTLYLVGNYLNAFATISTVSEKSQTSVMYNITQQTFDHL